MSARVVTELLKEHFQTARQGSKTLVAIGRDPYANLSLIWAPLRVLSRFRGSCRVAVRFFLDVFGIPKGRQGRRA